MTMFLVEEPEAHLHPQLQAAVLCFLEEQAEKSRKIKPGYRGPAGQLQVIVAAHSPNLSAWVSSERLVFFRSVQAKPKNAAEIGSSSETGVSAASSAITEATNDESTATATAIEADSTPVGIEAPEHSEPTEGFAPDTNPSDQAASSLQAVARRSTRCIPLSALSLSDSKGRKVARYLDVTKSALLFGGRVLLVEGIAEALLLPIIAKNHVLKDDQDKSRIFRSAVFVPIDGVDFECYMRLLLTPYNDIRIADRVVIITDGDRTDEAMGTATPGERRKSHAELQERVFGTNPLVDEFGNRMTWSRRIPPQRL